MTTEETNESTETQPMGDLADLKRQAMSRLKEIDGALVKLRSDKTDLAAKIKNLVDERVDVHRVVNAFAPRTRSTKPEKDSGDDA